MSEGNILIDAEQLSRHLDDPDYRVLDCRFNLADTEAGRRAYVDGHIPGAVYADLDKDLSGPIQPDSGRHPLPDVSTAAKTIGRLGIDGASRVVVYDGDNGSIAARAWWLLRWLGHERAQLLDGGIDAWCRAGEPLSQVTHVVKQRCFEARPRHGMVLTTAEIAANVETMSEFRLVDARDAARFRGELEPIDIVAGHIPGATNLPYSESLAADGTWKPQAALESVWRAHLGEDRRAPWSVMCGSGVTACHHVISALLGGHTEPRVYVGSWSEWIRDPERPIAAGEG